MTPIKFPEANTRFGPPSDLEESQCATIHAYLGKLAEGSLDGSPIVITAWKPSPEELQAMNEGAPVFLSFVGGLPPHFACTSFEIAKAIA